MREQPSPEVEAPGPAAPATPHSITGTTSPEEVDAARQPAPMAPERGVRERMNRLLRRVLPTTALRLNALRQHRAYVPPVGRIRWGDLRRLEPLSREYGYDRGLPVDRYWIEAFLARHAADIRGRVLEIGERTYTRRFGGDRVTRSDVLHVEEGNPEATFVADLTEAPELPSAAFDCLIITQTLHLLWDVRAALRTAQRLLRPDGVLLATFPGLSQICTAAWGTDWHWGFTTQSARKLFEEIFPAALIDEGACGNVLTATAFLWGASAGELTSRELDHHDPEYEALITVRAVKPGPSCHETSAGRWRYDSEPVAYGEDTSYRKGMAFLDGTGDIEDWGCGTGFARGFVHHSRYIGVDGSPSPGADRVADLATYTSRPDCIFMRHVLEHNFAWRDILANAIRSFRLRMTLIMFTPFADHTHPMVIRNGIPDIAFDRSELVALFEGCRWTEEALESDTEYGVEHIFYLEKGA